MFIDVNIFGSKAVFATSLLLKDPLLCVPRLLGVCLYRNPFPAVPQKNLICNDYLITLNL